MNNFKIFKNKKILITGHTGFKGSWLTLCLKLCGAKILGISNKFKSKPAHFNVCSDLKEIKSVNLDIKNFNKFNKVVNKFKPDFILISAGFDSRKDDPLGCFDISDKGFETLTTIVLQIAENHCNGRVLSILEGGYNVVGNAKAAVTHIETLNNFYKNI